MSKKYTLRNKTTQNLIGYYTMSNEGSEFCVDTQYILEEDSSRVWMVDSWVIAEWVRFNSTEWYNAHEESPTHNLNPDDWEVVEVEVTTTVTPINRSLPSVEEVANVICKGNKNYIEEMIRSGKENKLRFNDYWTYFDLTSS